MVRRRYAAVIAALAALRADSEYRLRLENPPDMQFLSFRQQVDFIELRCMELNPEARAQEEVRHRLEHLRALANGSLATFAPLVERARAALDVA
jgi:hypothetical protein